MYVTVFLDDDRRWRWWLGSRPSIELSRSVRIILSPPTVPYGSGKGYEECTPNPDANTYTHFSLGGQPGASACV